MGKVKTFYTEAKTVEKIHANQNENKKKPPENPTPYRFICHFSRKGSPFVYLLSVTNAAPSTYLV